MFSPPSQFQSVHDRFNFSIGRYFRWAKQRCERLSLTSEETSVDEMFVQERSLVFLDLALPSRRSVGWKTYSKTLVCRCFPTLTKEFFMAEKVEHEQGLSRLNNSVIQYNTERWLHFEMCLRRIFYGIVPGFEKRLLALIKSTHGDEKKQILYRYLRTYEKFHIDLFDKRFPFLVFHCTNPPLESELTVHMLRTVCDTDEKKFSALSTITDETNLETLLYHAAEMKFDFWGMWSGSGYLAHQLDFVAAFLELGVYLKCAIVLLKFGFPYLSDDYAFGIRCSNLLSITFPDGSPVMRTVQPLMEKARVGLRIRMMLIIDTFSIFGDFNETGDIEDRVRTLLYLTRSLPEPYVTPSELYSTMQQVVVPGFIPNLEAIVNLYSEAAIFDDEYDIHSPRRLMHLCRVVVRKRLASNFKLLVGIEDLVIPSILKRYLKLEDSVAESTRVNLDQEVYVF